MSDKIIETNDASAEQALQAGKKAWNAPVLEGVDLSTVTKGMGPNPADAPASPIS